MKKITALLLCICMVLSAAALASCEKSDDKPASDGNTAAENASGDNTAAAADVALTDIMAAMVAEYPDIPAEKKLYIASATEDDDYDHWLDPEYAGFLFTGDYEECAEWAMLEDFAIRLPEGKSAFELHIFKVADSKNIDAIKTLCQNRIDQINASDIKLYDAEGFAKVFGNAEVYTVDNYVFLLITTDNTGAKAAITAKLGK